jgi:hypothetical protein
MLALLLLLLLKSLQRGVQSEELRLNVSLLPDFIPSDGAPARSLVVGMVVEMKMDNGSAMLDSRNMDPEVADRLGTIPKVNQTNSGGNVTMGISTVQLDFFMAVSNQNPRLACSNLALSDLQQALKDSALGPVATVILVQCLPVSVRQLLHVAAST